jgi:hypothetical protein
MNFVLAMFQVLTAFCLMRYGNVSWEMPDVSAECVLPLQVLMSALGSSATAETPHQTQPANIRTVQQAH